jgi:hypothetical protein
VLSLPLTGDGLRTANRLTAPAGSIEHVLPIWLNSAGGNLTAASRTNGRVRPTPAMALCFVRELAHPHVVDHALPQRRDPMKR